MDSEIKPFYKNTNILITGATGLFGKMLIQKLLQTCNDLDGIYLIVREKKDKIATERMQEVYKDAVFNKLKEENPNFSKKIHIMNGDFSTLNIGLSQTNRKILTDKINIVFHCAASLNMDAKMKDAVDTNVRGLNELLDLCHEMRYLKSMVFVSTAYSNCTQYVIEEKFYKTPIQATTLMKLTEEIDKDVLDSITPGIVDIWPNTYCYTKAVAENMFYNRAGRLPVGVFRPSIGKALLCEHFSHAVLLPKLGSQQSFIQSAPKQNAKNVLYPSGVVLGLLFKIKAVYALTFAIPILTYYY